MVEHTGSDEFFTRVERAFDALVDEDLRESDFRLEWAPWSQALRLSWFGDDGIRRLVEATRTGPDITFDGYAYKDQYEHGKATDQIVGRRKWTSLPTVTVAADEDVQTRVREDVYPTLAALDRSDLGSDAPISENVTVSDRELSVSCVQPGWMNWQSVMTNLERDYGISVGEDPTNSDEALNNLRQNRRDYSVFNGGYTHCIRARNEGYTRPYRPDGWEAIPNEFRTDDGHVTATRQVTIALIYRRDRYPDPPRTWEELLESALVDDLALQSTGAVGLATIVSINHALGGTLDATKPVAEYYRSLTEAGATFVDSFVRNDIEHRFKRGDYGAFVRYDYSGLQLKYADGEIPAKDVGVTLLEAETNVGGSGSLSMLYGNALLESESQSDRNRAELFMDYVLSPDGGQRHFLDSYIRPVRIEEFPDSEKRDRLLSAEEYDRAKFVTDYERLVDRQEAILREIQSLAAL